MKIVLTSCAAMLIGFSVTGCKMDSDKNVPTNTSTSGAGMGTTPGADMQPQNGGMNMGTTNSGNSSGTMSTSAPSMHY